MGEKLKSKKKLLKPDHASTIYLQVIGSGAPGAPRSLFVFTEHCRYLFNCGEGTQRLASEHKVKLSMTEHIIITGKSWENIGGLLGTLLTLQDAGVSEITVHGPSKIETFYNDTKHFTQFANLKVNYKHYDEKAKVIEKGPIEIEAIPLEIPNEAQVDDSAKFKKEISTKNEEEFNEAVDESNMVLSYICKAAPKPGALLPLRCRELGVPLGPLMGELKNGKDITLPNGNIVQTKDVTEPPNAGINFIVIDIPSKSYVEALGKCEHFWKHQKLKGCKTEDVADVVVHFTSWEIVEEPSYQQWINDFGTSTSHIYINEKSTCMGSESVHKIQYKLNHLYPESFPLLNDIKLVTDNSFNDEDYCNSSKRLKISEKQFINIENGKWDERKNHYQSFTCLTYHIRPPLKIDLSKRIKIDPEEYIKECYAVENFSRNFKQVQEKVEEMKFNICCNYQEREFPHILFLGTGSCIPNKTRNTSGIAVFINSHSTMLLDCGEGTYGQLVRHLGLPTTDQFLRFLCVIYISHLHADHHIGLIRILLARKKVLEKRNTEHEAPKLKLLAPKHIVHYLNSYNTYFETISDQFDLISNDLFTKMKSSIEDQRKNLSDIGINNIETCYVHHCSYAYGMAMTLEDGFKIAYSGDTMPCSAFVDVGAGCDLLIHEATMEDDLQEDARIKRHSTTSQAIEVGNQMEAKYIILTHFSQRYAKVPLLEVVPENVIISFDNMMIKLRDLPCLSHLYPTYKIVFSEDIDEILKKRAKRNNEIK